MTTVNLQVGAGADDGEAGSALFSSTGDWINIGKSGGGTSRNAWARFSGVSIEGTIDDAHIQWYRHVQSIESTETDIYAVDEDDPPNPANWGEYDGDPVTAASVPWDGDPGTGWITSPSIVSVIQELVDTYTISDDHIQIYHKNTGGVNSQEWWLSAYENDTSLAAKLDIDYTEAGIGADEMMAAIGPGGGGGGGGSGDILAYSRTPPEAIAY